jgi:large subunit ribosomal protein L17
MKKLGRNTPEREALMRNLVSSLLTHQEITTTVQKAKEAKRLADRVITMGKTDSLHSRRKAYSVLQNHDLTSKLFKEVAPRFKSRNGGYTRIMQLATKRKGDGADMAILELTEKEIIIKETPKKQQKAKKDSHGHDHEAHDAHASQPHAAPDAAARPKHAEPKKDKPQQKGQFFKNLGKFFRNKGGG